MKANIYDVCIAFTMNALVTSECNCTAGSCDNDQHVCMHILALVVLFDILIL